MAASYADCPVSHQPPSSTSFGHFLSAMHQRVSNLLAPDGQEVLSPNATTTSTQTEWASEGNELGTTRRGDMRLHEDLSPRSIFGHDRMTPLQNESPLHRAGFLQPKSYNASTSTDSLTGVIHPHSFARPAALHAHSQDIIRQATVELSSMPGPSFVSRASFNPSPAIPEAGPSSQQAEQSFIFPSSASSRPQFETAPHSRTSSPPPSSVLTQSISSLPPSDVSTSTLESDLVSLLSTSNINLNLPIHSQVNSAEATVSSQPPGRQRQRQQKPSGLSLLRPLSSSSSFSSPPSSSSSPERGLPKALGSDTTPTPMGTPRPLPRPLGPTSIGKIDSIPPAEVSTSINVSSSGETERRGRGRPGHPDSFTSHHVHWRDPSHSPVHSALSHSRSPLLTRAQLTHDDPDTIGEVPVIDETTPLLVANSSSPPDSGIPPSYLSRLSLNSRPDKGPGHVHDVIDGSLSWGECLHSLKQNVRKASVQNAARRVGNRVEELKTEVKKLHPLSRTHLRTALRSIPAVLLGCLLNILDGVSYGMIIFPATGIFADLGPMGVSMFFVSAIIAQLVYTFGGSGFAGGNGSMMIEVVPFFHILASNIAGQIGEDQPREIIATTLVAYSISAILTGTTFFLLGALKLGVVVGFFPRHILVGCIGGVGVFLVLTGLTVSMRISDDDFTLSWETLCLMFEPHNLILWVLPLALAILLRTITHKYHHQLIFPIYFMIIPFIFYIVVAAARLDLGTLRHEGWLFDIASTAREPWYHFYSYFDYRLIQFAPLWSTLPTQFALLFFNILHPPLNVPALAVSLDMDVDTDKELVAHGYSNLLSGFLGSVPNYLVYVNTLLFYRVGGETRISGFMLALATFGLLVVGTAPIAYLPIMVVGALIFVLGIDLVKEALWDTRHRVSKMEYITILSIMICMTVWDFVVGVLFGIVVSCFFFVVQNSHRRSIRAVFTGDTAMSAVRRPSFQRAYIREVARQTTVLRLQGFLFFGTITYVEEKIRDLVDGPSYQTNPVQFLILDFSVVAGVDMSSAEALVRVQRLLSVKYVTLVFCGFEVESPVGQALESVGLLGAERVELFSTFNDAMEWTENAYLRAWYRHQKQEMGPVALIIPGRQDADIEYGSLVGSFVRSPRRTQLRDAGDRTIATEIMAQQGPQYTSEPLNTVIKAFSSYGTVDIQLFSPIAHYLERIPLPTGHVVWKQNDPPDGLYILESGVLRAIYEFENSAQDFEESMVAGTVAGELSALSDCPRNSTVVVEHAAVLWKLSSTNLHRLQIEQPELARVFIQLVLKAAKVDYDILLAAIASRQ